MPEPDDNTQPIYERLKNEPNGWFHRFLLYRNMGPTRSILGAFHVEKVAKSESLPNCAPDSWYKASHKHDWKFRAELYDKAQYERAEANRKALEALEQEEIARIMSSGYAAIHERVKGLDRIAKVLEASFTDKDTGDIQYQFLTPDKIREFRGCLDDIAKELGARSKKVELTGKAGQAIEIVTTQWGGGVLDQEDQIE